jgi:twinkle protein
MIQKLGPSRCVLVQGGLGAKDANDALLKGLDLEAMLGSAAAMSHKQIVTFSQFRNDVKRMFTDPNAHVGVQLANMPHLQSLMKGHRRGEFTIFTGPTGMGKVRHQVDCAFVLTYCLAFTAFPLSS